VRRHLMSPHNSVASRRNSLGLDEQGQCMHDRGTRCGEESKKPMRFFTIGSARTDCTYPRLVWLSPCEPLSR